MEATLLLTRPEACRLLSLSMSEYLRLVRAGVLREVKRGRRWRRLPRAEAERFAAKLAAEVDIAS